MKIRKFNEHKYIESKLDQISDYLYNNGFLAKMYINDNSIYLMDFIRGKSEITGTDAMLKITEFADKNNLNIKLLVSPNYGIELKKLIDFYKKFGFEIVGDYYNNSKEMIRKYGDQL